MNTLENIVVGFRWKTLGGFRWKTLGGFRWKTLLYDFVAGTFIVGMRSRKMHTRRIPLSRQTNHIYVVYLKYITKIRLQNERKMIE